MVSLRFKLRMLRDFPLFRQKREATGCFLFRRRTEEEEEKISLGQLQSLQRAGRREGEEEEEEEGLAR